jgi:hypothetical protein
MRTTSRLFCSVLVAAGLLAISAAAAQAMPTRPSTDVGKNPGFAVTGHPGGPSLNRNLIGVGYTGQSAANVSNVYQGFYGGQALYKHDAAAKISSVMSLAVDPPNAQQVPIVVTQAVPQPVNVADSGFNWTAGMLGAGIATLVLLLAAITASRIRPHRVAQF